MIKDRGNIKWTSLMLPEHVKLLREWSEEDKYVDKPMLDEDKQMEINQVIQQAMSEDEWVTFTYYENKQYNLFVGKVIHYDPVKRTLKVKDKCEQSSYFEINCIVDVQIP